MLILNMSLNTFTYKATYTIVRTLYECFELIYCTLWNYYQILPNLYHKYTTDDKKYIKENIKYVNKIPTHLSVILGDEKPSYEDLAKLVIWCISSNITYISFYDHKGILKNSEEKLNEAVENARNENDTHIIWHNKNRYQNGYTGKKIYVRTLSLNDGRENIVYTTKKLCKNKVRNIDIATVDRNLREKYAFPDPDLCLYCGKIFALYGYPPWEVRLTEFISIGSHHSINSKTFMKSLCRFSKTEMRLGR